MNTDAIWGLFRYGLIAAGTVAATYGWIKLEDVGAAVDTIVPALGGIVAGLTALWGVYINLQGKRVPNDVAKRIDVPTVSPATGQVQPPTLYH